MARSPYERPKSYDHGEPNHMIFWFDRHIGNPQEYIHLKKAFGSNTDPRCETWTMLTDKDYDMMIPCGDTVTVTFEGVEFLLQAFNNEDACLEAFEQNQDKRIFFITSGSLGREVVPKVIERYRHIFTDPITDEPYPSVYIFCHSIEYNMGWAWDYVEYIQMFDFDAVLLERITRDIAEYYIEQSNRIRQDNDLKGAFQRLHWAKRLWYQYDKMQQGIETCDTRPVRESQGMKKINELIIEIEEVLIKESTDDDTCLITAEM